MVTPLPKPRPSSRPRNDGFTTQSERERFYALPDRQPDEVVSPAVPTPRVPSSRVPSPVISQSGTLTSQPAITEPEIPTPEPFQDLEGLGIIPDVRDKAAPRFKPGQHTLSAEAIRSRSNRIFSKRADGSKKVSDEIWNDWKSKGPKKQLLEDIFRRCGYDPETWFLRRFFFRWSILLRKFHLASVKWTHSRLSNTYLLPTKETFICEVEVMKSELTESEVTVEGEFVSQSTMEEWGWSEYLFCFFIPRKKI